MKTFKQITTGLILAFSLVGCLPTIEGETVQVDTAGTGTKDPGFSTVPDESGSAGTTPDAIPTNPVPGSAPVASITEGILINGGAQFTSSNNLNLSIYKEESLLMKLTANGNCQGGTWVNYEERINFELPQELQNQEVNLSVRFSDLDGSRSGCYTAAILHDNAGPEILFQKYPEVSVQEGIPVEIVYNVTDGGSGVDQVTCALNGFVKSCTGGRTVVNIPGAAPGYYTFEVTATDKVGFASKKSVTWVVVSVGRRITHDIRVSEYRKWDILIVDDNSGSMSYEQRSMASRTRNFLSILRGLDWQIAVTTTDQRTSRSCIGCDGAFIELSSLSGKFILNSSMMDEANAQAVLSQTLQRREVGSASEQGIRSVYRVIERSLSGLDPVHAQFIRADANLAVVLISDEDESANTPKNDPQNLLNLVKEKYNSQKNFIFNSIITVPGDTACRTSYGATYGERYKVMTQLTGGVMGSVCESDYAVQMTGIAENIKSMAKSFTLNCVPMTERGVSVLHNGVAINNAFTVSGVKLTFDQPIEPGNYQLVYYCLNQ